MKDATRRRQSLVFVVLMLCLAGAWISGQLVKQHADVWHIGEARAGLFARVCQAAEQVGFDCAGPTMRSLGQIVIPVPLITRDWHAAVHRVVVPVAFLGLAYFVFIGSWVGLLGQRYQHGTGWNRVPVLVGLFGVTVSVCLIGGMAFGFAPRCVWCLAVHLVNLLMVFAIWRLYRQNRGAESLSTPGLATSQEVAARILTTRDVVNVVAVSLILIAGLWFYRRDRLATHQRMDHLLPYKSLVTALQQDPAFLLREYHAQAQYDIPPRSTEVVSADRPQLVVFTDFECPACYCKSLWLRAQATKLSDDGVTVAVRHFPLSSACNEWASSDRHQQACEAAHAAEAARLIGGETAFWRMHDLLFENRKNLHEGLYRDLALQAGLDPDLLVHEMESEKVAQIVRSDIELGSQLGVTGTPSVFFAGRRVTSLCQTPVFWEAVSNSYTSSGERQSSKTATHQRGSLASTKTIK